MNELNIGVAFPACDIPNKTLALAKKKLEKHGLIIKTSNYISDKKAAPFRYNPEVRAKELNALFLDKSIHAIVCARGGYGSQKIIKYLDFNIIKQNPKTFIGYSDITALLNQIQQNTGLITQHGPMIKELAFINNKSFFTKFRKDLLNNFKNSPNFNMEKCEILQEGSAEGVLIGGNLTTICSSFATSYEINVKNKILFLEEVGEEFYKIDRLLNQLCGNKKIHETKAIILGDFSSITNKKLKYRLNLKHLILNLLKDYTGPILWGFPAGHKNKNNFLPIGQKIKVNLLQNQKEIKFLI